MSPFGLEVLPAAPKLLAERKTNSAPGCAEWFPSALTLLLVPRLVAQLPMVLVKAE